MALQFFVSRLRIWLLLGASSLLVCFLSPGQKAGNVQYGSWTANAGPAQVFRGSWSSETSAATANEARGSWTLVSDAGEILLQGTWSARKTGAHWRGTWKARTQQGQAYAGTWDADLPEGKNETFGDLLKRTIEKQVAGSWQSGRSQGYWWLKGDKPKK